MFGIEILEVIIGLVFVYLLFAMLVTLINEYINSIFRLRSKNLKNAISRLLDDENSQEKISELFYSHPLIKYYSQKGKLPSYISSGAFAKVLMDLVRTGTQLKELGVTKLDKQSLSEILVKLKHICNPETFALLQSFALEAGNDVNKFTAKLERWFEEAMDRAQGWYLRKIKYITFIVSLIIAVGLNVDSVKVYRTLSTDANIRADVLEAANDFSSQQQYRTAGSDSATVSESMKRLEEFYMREVMPNSNSLGLGWGSEERAYLDAHIPSALLGWLLTAFAISLGAPFWFDILNKFMRLRAATPARVEPPVSSTVNENNPSQPSALSKTTVNGSREQPAVSSHL